MPSQPIGKMKSTGQVSKPDSRHSKVTVQETEMCCSDDDDPVAQALAWQEQGAQRLHLVDLDGARSGEPVNDAVVRAITAAADPGAATTALLQALGHPH